MDINAMMQPGPEVLLLALLGNNGFGVILGAGLAVLVGWLGRGRENRRDLREMRYTAYSELLTVMTDMSLAGKPLPGLVANRTNQTSDLELAVQHLNDSTIQSKRHRMLMGRQLQADFHEWRQTALAFLRACADQDAELTRKMLDLLWVCNIVVETSMRVETDMRIAKRGGLREVRAQRDKRIRADRPAALDPEHAEPVTEP